jgi:hypothetical protein
MAKGKESFERRQRERAKKAKADQKRERRLSRDDDPTPEEEAEPRPQVDEEVVLAQLAKLHQDFEDEKVTFDDFEERRAELLARLQVD